MAPCAPLSYASDRPLLDYYTGQELEARLFKGLCTAHSLSLSARGVAYGITVPLQPPQKKNK